MNPYERSSTHYAASVKIQSGVKPPHSKASRHSRAVLLSQSTALCTHFESHRVNRCFALLPPASVRPRMNTRPFTAVLASILVFSLRSFAADIADDESGKRGELIPFDRAPVHPPKDTRDSAAQSLAKTRLPRGFTADLWASEPLLANPVAFTFDGQGRMYVCETHRYRSSVLDIRNYYWMIEDDLACRNQDDWLASIKRNFPKDWQQLGRESEIVRLLEDTKGAGKADKSSVFADGFKSPLDGIAAGVLEHNGSVWLTNIPALWRLDGLTPDGKAKKKEELLRGFGVRFSYTGHDFHGIVMGPDGRLYFSIGDRGASVKTKEGTTIELPDEGGVFRCETDGTHLELVMRGLRNPQELAFDDHGNLFTADNDADLGDRERWVVVVEGADAGWRIGYQHHPLGAKWNPWLAEHQWEPRQAGMNQPAAILSPIANLPDGPSGLTHYPGTGLPANYARNFFLCGFKGTTTKSAVYNFRSEPDGAGFRLAGLTEFMEHVQATDVDFGPDSRLYVSAWDEGWDRTDQGRIYRISHEAARKAQATQIAEVQSLLAEGFGKRSGEELVKLLAHWDRRVRLGAQWAIGEKLVEAGRTADRATSLDLGERLSKAIREGVTGERKDLSQLHAIWASGFVVRTVANDFAKRSGGPPPPMPEDSLDPALLTSPDPEVHTQMLRSVADYPGEWTEGLLRQVETKLRHESSRIRFAAAMALAKKGNDSAAPAIVAMLRENADKDQYLRHAGVMALAKCANEASLAAAAKDRSRAVRLAALLAFRRLGKEGVTQFLADSEPAIVMEAARAITDAPIPAGMPALAAFLMPAPKGSSARGAVMKDEMFAIRALDAAFRMDAQGTVPRGPAALLAFACNKNASEALRNGTLSLLEQWPNPPARDIVTGLYRPMQKHGADAVSSIFSTAIEELLAEKSESIRIATCRVAGTISMDKVTAESLRKFVLRTDAPVRARMAALDALGAKENGSEFNAALAFAATDRNPALRTEARKLLGVSSPAKSAELLAADYADAAIAEKKSILAALGENRSEKADDFLAGLMHNFARQPATIRVELLEAAAKRKAAGVTAAVAAYEASLPNGDPLAKFAVALQGGDKAAGEKLFKEHPVAACLRCHKIGVHGGDAGPALDGIARIKDRAYILESLILPNAKIAKGFQMQIITTTKGETIAGLLKWDTGDSVGLQMPGSPTVNVKKADIKQRDNAPSGMLTNLGDLLTKREIRDLVEFVASLR